MTDDFARLFDRDLAKLLTELESFSTEALLWAKPSGVSNSAGNLALHLIGNVEHYIGAGLGGTAFKRDRAAEFGSTAVALRELLERVAATRATLHDVLSALTTAQLEADYPEPVQGQMLTTRYFLLHLYGHFSYHLGQINYVRRVLHG